MWTDIIFRKYYPDFKKLIEYGFLKTGDKFVYEKIFFNNQFITKIVIDESSTIKGTVFDVESDDEFLPLRIEDNEGGFVSNVREEYKKILEDIRDNCFIRKYFIYSQSNGITNKIIEKYGDYPEFLWEKFDNTGIFRNKKTKKWYGIIMDVDRSKIIKNQKGKIEVLNVKLDPVHIEKLLLKPNFYKGYHMNKKYWLSIILDDSVEDDIIMKLVDESYKLADRR